MCFAFCPEYISLPDEDGKPLGTSAALLLSLLVGLRPAEGGWFGVTVANAMELTGFSQDTICRLRMRLMAAGYVRFREKGQGGSIQYFVPDEMVKPQKAVKPQNAVKHSPNTNEIVKPQNAVKHTGDVESAKDTNEMVKPQNAVKQASSVGDVKPQNAVKQGVPPLVPPSSLSPTPSLSSPPYNPPKKEDDPENPPAPCASLRGTPPKGATPPQAPQRQCVRANKPADFEECRGYFVEIDGNLADAEKFWDWFEANGWRTNQGVLRSWRAAARNWVRRSKDFENSGRGGSRASPANGTAPRETELEALLRMEREGVQW